MEMEEEGVSTAPAVVVEKTEVARSIFRFLLQTAYPTPTGEAGSHIDVHLPSGLVRQYSLVSSNRGTRTTHEIAVLREEDGRGGSVELCDEVRIGHRLQISEPRSNFSLEPDRESYLLLGAGIGITPLLYMADELERSGARFSFHVCARTPEHVAFKSELDAADYAGRVTYHFSRTPESGRLDLPAFLRVVPADTQIYACGPSRFLDEIDESTPDWPAWRVRKERFSNELEEVPESQRGEFTIKLAKSNLVLSVPADKSVLEVLADAGVPTASSCREGVCGTCVTAVLSGEILHRDACLYDEEKEENTAMACCVSRGVPGTTVVLDL